MPCFTFAIKNVICYNKQMDPIVLHLSKLVKEFRARNEWSLDTFSEAAGLSRSLIYQIEQGKTVPTLTALKKLADAMGMGLQEIVAPLDQKKSTRRGNLKEIPQQVSLDGSFKSVALHSLFETGDLEFFKFCFVKKGEHRAVRPAGVVIIVFVESGQLSLEENGETYNLSAGDVAEIHPNRFYTYRQITSRLSKGYILISHY